MSTNAVSLPALNTSFARSNGDYPHALAFLHTKQQPSRRQPPVLHTKQRRLPEYPAPASREATTLLSSTRRPSREAIATLDGTCPSFTRSNRPICLSSRFLHGKQLATRRQLHVLHAKQPENPPAVCLLQLKERHYSVVLACFTRSNIGPPAKSGQVRATQLTPSPSGPRNLGAWPAFVWARRRSPFIRRRSRRSAPSFEQTAGFHAGRSPGIFLQPFAPPCGSVGHIAP